jgi:hypothetical protein
LRRDRGPHPKTGITHESRRDERRRKRDLEMYPDRFYMMEDRVLREQYLAERIAERRNQTLATVRRPSLRARVARRLFALAVAAEREETWRVVWERLEAKGRL